MRAHLLPDVSRRSGAAWNVSFQPPMGLDEASTGGIPGGLPPNRNVWSENSHAGYVLGSRLLLSHQRLSWR